MTQKYVPRRKRGNSAIIICVTGRCLFRSLRRIGQQTRTLLFVLIPNLSIRDDWKKRGILPLSIPVQIIKKEERKKKFFPDGIHSGQRKEKLISYRLYFAGKKEMYKDLLCLPPLSFLVILLFSPHIHSNAIYFSDYGYFPCATTRISNADRTRI